MCECVGVGVGEESGQDGIATQYGLQHAQYGLQHAQYGMQHGNN